MIPETGSREEMILMENSLLIEAGWSASLSADGSVVAIGAPSHDGDADNTDYRSGKNF